MFYLELASLVGFDSKEGVLFKSHARCSMKCPCEYFGFGSDARALESIDSCI